jgi:hypothetical protein
MFIPQQFSPPVVMTKIMAREMPVLADVLQLFSLMFYYNS